MKRILHSIYLTFFFCFIYSCEAQEKKDNSVSGIENQFTEEFKKYWYQGTAELSAYELNQARYGEMHKGEVVMVFVTEDFLVNEQVKKEYNTSSETTSVLKLNLMRKFPTGIYDYSVMTSVFTPIIQNESINPLKLTTSSQEWCGHSWLQLNKKSNSYWLSTFSYFQSEADKAEQIDLKVLEDGFWTQIRLNPDQLPLGNMKIFPSAQYLRFSHKELKAYDAEVKIYSTVDSSFIGDNLMSLEVNYPGLNRTISIVYEKEFPHQIVGWRELRKSGFGKASVLLETTGRLKAQILSPYWEKNTNKDKFLRDSLMLAY